jgi:hypothetical protein
MLRLQLQETAVVRKSMPGGVRGGTRKEPPTRFAPIFRLRHKPQRPMYERTRLTLRQPLEHLGSACFMVCQLLVLAHLPPGLDR